jgi:hypothetical protein
LIINESRFILKMIDTKKPTKSTDQLLEPTVVERCLQDVSDLGGNLAVDIIKRKDEKQTIEKTRSPKQLGGKARKPLVNQKATTGDSPSCEYQSPLASRTGKRNYKFDDRGKCLRFVGTKTKLLTRPGSHEEDSVTDGIDLVVKGTVPALTLNGKRKLNFDCIDCSPSPKPNSILKRGMDHWTLHIFIF